MAQKNIKGFVQVSKSWFADSVLSKDNPELFLISEYDEDDEAIAQFEIQWELLNGETVSKLIVWDDCWASLNNFQDLLSIMAEVDSAHIDPEEFRNRLLNAGMVDKTSVKD